MSILLLRRNVHADVPKDIKFVILPDPVKNTVDISAPVI